MALNDIRFTTAAGGLGRLPANDDHVSAIIFPFTASPAAWSAGVVGKKYLSLDEAEADLIVETDVNTVLPWYFIREFFRMGGAVELWVVNSGAAGFSAQTVFALTEGRLRQVFWYAATAYAALAARVGTVQAFATSLAALHSPCVFLINVKDETTAVDGALQTDLATLNSPEVSVVAFGDGSGKGKAIATSLGVKHVPAGGTVLGLLARSQVHVSPAYVEASNLAQGDDFQKIALSDGRTSQEVGASVLDTLNTKRYLFAVKHIGIAGAYVHDGNTCTASTSDYAYIENNRTIHKAKRFVRAALLPKLSAPLSVDADGKLAPDSVESFARLAEKPLKLMQAAGELSGDAANTAVRLVVIDPDQDVLATSTLAIGIKVQPRGVARNINVNIGFAVSVA